MIKINEAKFDIEVINKIYDDLTSKIVEKFKKYKNLPNHSDIIVEKIEEMFGCEEDILKENIKNYINNSRIDEINRTIIFFRNHGESFDQQDYIILTVLFEFRDSTLVKNIFNKLEKVLGENYVDKINAVKMKLDVCFSNLTENDTFHKIRGACWETLREDNVYKGIIESLEFSAEIEKVISYDILTSRQRHELINAMHIEVCPYCNRQFITSWECEDGNFHSTADLDHFYPKSLYPIASLCLHNFIPSCQICNSRFKLAKDFFTETHIYPYDYEFGDDAKFEIDNIGALIDQSPIFTIHQKKASSKIENSIKTFHLNEVYKSHTDYIQELIEKVRMYNYTQIEEYIYGLNGMFNSREEILLFIFGDILNKSKCDKNPLAKLTCDILENLGVKI